MRGANIDLYISQRVRLPLIMSIVTILQRVVSGLAATAKFEKGKSVVAGAALAGVVIASAVIPSGSNVALAKTTSSPVRQVGGAFLTLPFEGTSRMSVLSGWYYSGGGGFHGGIDYINGSVNNMDSWRTFAVIASADGDACGNCSSRQGNAVWVQHDIGGSTYYTYYGHLASIAGGIPLGSQSRTVHVKRGQILGWAGDTGARGVLHLHFGLYDSASRPIDPYTIGRLREYYPQPSDNSPGIGWFR